MLLILQIQVLPYFLGGGEANPVLLRDGDLHLPVRVVPAVHVTWVGEVEQHALDGLDTESQVRPSLIALPVLG